MTKLSGIEIDKGSITSMITEMERMQTKLQQALWIVTDSVAKKMEEWAKDNAPWTDRTSNARNGLNGKAYWEDANTLVLSMAHTVSYGVWLELAHERKFAVLEKSIQQYKDDLIRQYNKIVGGV